MTPEWPGRLREARLRAGLSQEQAGKLAAVSTETVRAYEAGRRSPTRERLIALLKALSVSAADARRILESAGFHAPESLFPPERFPDYFFTVEQLQTEVELVPWPEFVINNANELVAANRAAQKLWSIDFAVEREVRSRAQLNLLSVASQRRFAEKILNWDECIGTMASVFKGRPQDPASIDAPDPYFSEVLSEFAEGDPQFLAKLVNVWAATPARTPKVRWSYRIDWEDEHAGVMHFLALVSTASEPDALSFNDWYPLDAASWVNLSKLLG